MFCLGCHYWTFSIPFNPGVIPAWRYLILLVSIFTFLPSGISMSKTMHLIFVFCMAETDSFYWPSNEIKRIRIDRVYRVLDRNSWNHTTVCKLFLLDRNTWKQTTIWKLFVLNRNTWNHTKVCKLFILNNCVQKKILRNKNMNMNVLCTRFLNPSA